MEVCNTETSYLAQAKRFDNPVAICREVPGWYKGRTYSKLAPQRAWMNEPPEVYVPLFQGTVLGPLDPREVYTALGEDATLLCYEKDPNGCHRRLVAEWFEETLKVKVPEHDWFPRSQKTLDLF